MKQNRIPNEQTTDDDKPLPRVRARRSWHWTCAECGRTQICKRSETHEARCWGCMAKVLVDIKEAK